MYSDTHTHAHTHSRLLFTDDSVLPHEVGKGQSAFKWHKRSKPGSSHADVTSTSKHKHSTMTNAESVCSDTTPSTDDTNTKSVEKMESTNQECPEGAGSPHLLAHTDITPEGLAKLRAQVATVTSLSGPSSSDSCSSYFVEPMEWMESTLLGRVEGKVNKDGCLCHLNIPVNLQYLTVSVCTINMHNQLMIFVNVTTCNTNSYGKFVKFWSTFVFFISGAFPPQIQCPKCSARLGSFSWSGDQCSCGQWITPSLQIHRSKVDETRTLTKRKIAATKKD